jgi:rubredoxin
MTMVRHFDLPKPALFRAIEDFRDFPPSLSTSTISHQFGVSAKAVLAVANFKEIPATWNCPVCGSSKIDLFAPSTGDFKKVRLERHHDHLEDFFGVFRFRRTVLCADCNNYDARLKAALNTDPDLPLIDWRGSFDSRIEAPRNLVRRVPHFFSFSPTEMSRCIKERTDATIVNPREMEIAKQVFADAMGHGLDSLLQASRHFMDKCGTGSWVHDEDGATLHKELGVNAQWLGSFVDDIFNVSDFHTLGPGDDVFVYSMNGVRPDIHPKKMISSETVYQTDSYTIGVESFTPNFRPYPSFQVRDYLLGSVGSISQFRLTPNAGSGVEYFMKWSKACRVFDVDDNELSLLLKGSIDGPWSTMTKGIMSAVPSERLRIDFSSAYISAGEYWTCPICSRDKLGMLFTASKSKKTIAACKNYGPFTFEGTSHFSPVTICLECEVFASQMNKAAQTAIAADIEVVHSFCSFSYGNGDAVSLEFSTKFRFDPEVLFFLRKYRRNGKVPQEKVIAALKWWMDKTHHSSFLGDEPGYISPIRQAFLDVCNDNDLDPKIAYDILAVMAHRLDGGAEWTRPGTILVTPSFKVHGCQEVSFDPKMHVQKINSWIASKVETAQSTCTDFFDFARNLAAHGVRIRLSAKNGALTCHYSFFFGSYSRTFSPNVGNHALPPDVHESILRQIEDTGGAVMIDDVFVADN